MTFKLNSPSLLQHFAWLPLRIFGKMFCSFEVRGIKNIYDLSGNIILASNHGSELDPLMLVAALPYFSRILPLIFVSRTKEFYKESPRGTLYGGKFFEMMGAYPAFPGLNDYKKALKHHLFALNNGSSVCIFPVGRKHKSSEIKQARGGVSYLALKTGIPIIPVKIEGLGGYSIGDYLKGKTKIIITFGSALYAKDIFHKYKDLRPSNITHEYYQKAAVRLMNKIEKL